ITSFTELENPYHIYFRLGEDASSPEDCIVQPGFSASQYLQAEFLVPKVKHCKNPHAQKLKEAHILHMKQAPKETSFQPGMVKVKVNVVCPEAKLLQDLEILLILQSQENVTWRVDMKNNGAILTRGKYWLSTFPDMQMNGRALPDNEEGLTGLAHEKDFGDVAFYRDIPSASHLTIELHRCGAEATPTTPTLIHTPPMQDLQDILIQAYVSLNTPWKCTDDTMEIAVPRSTEYLKEDITAITLRDTGCKAEPNKTHFVLKRYLGDCNTTLESEAKASNKLILTLAASMKKDHKAFEALPSRGLTEPQLQLYQTQDFKWPSTTVLQVNKTAYVQISFRSSNAQTNLMVKECSVQVATQEPQRLLLSPGASHGKAVTILPPKEATLGRELHQFSLVYTPAGGRPLPPCATLVCTLTNLQPRSPRLEVTGSAFLRPPNHPWLLVSCAAPGLGIEAVVGITFAAFLIGTLLTAALWCIYTHTPAPSLRPQVVLNTTPASESSSTNHSIGSTQSTPCSTSSTA
uniref:Endoglin n=1 Tax=Pelodiscus sinensis TaxID=13735 RepID=K7FU53_PELSI